VVINRGTFSTNVEPTILILASATNVASSAVVNFSASANDNNGDALAYYWDFGDGSFGTNGTAASKSWSTGEFVVRCTVSDMKGGVASDSVLVRVGSPSTFRISGRVTTNDVPIEGVRVFASASRSTYTDSDGTYMLAGLIAGTFTVAAQLDGYNFAYPTYSTPISVGPNVANADFDTSSAIPPSFASQPQGLGVAVGSNAMFSVIAENGSPVRYQWLSWGSPIAGATNFFLVIQTAQLSDAGNYSVVLSNRAGTVESASATLSVNAAPVLSVVPDHVVNAGSVLSISNAATDQNDGDILSFGLSLATLPGASVDSASGLFTWSTPASAILLTNRITLFVADNGSPTLSNVVTFQIVVIPPPQIAAIIPSADGQVSFRWQTFPGKTYRIQFKSDLQDAIWSDWGNPITATNAILSIEESLTANPQRFYRILQVD
ncbi:MAG: PKD domain-containing protein, partial [Verrucomicrobiota bacterium]